jgi:putative endonuclease
MYTIYILKCADDSFYTGITNDLEKRLGTHKIGKGSKYVRTRLPFELIYKEKLETRSEALKREYEIKALTKAQKLQLVSIGHK